VTLDPSPRGDSVAFDDRDAVHRINLSWLGRLRWATIAGQAAVIAFVQWGMNVPLPLGSLVAILAVEAVANVGFRAWLVRGRRVSEQGIAAALGLDVLCFTGLLYLTGGPFNPFSFLYLVYIALAAIVLRPRWAWTLVLLSASCSAALFLDYVPLPRDHGDHMHMHHGAHEAMGTHLRGMWVAFAVAAAFIVYFIHRVTSALADRDAELARSRERTTRTQRVAGMATLAAGAAHELATPLSTIAVAAKELERHARDDAVRADAKLIREQVERCRDILGQMAGHAGEAPGEIATETTMDDIVRSALGGLANPERVRIDWNSAERDGGLFVPVRATAQALRNVIKNALDASPDDGDVVLRIAAVEGGFRLEVEDHGSGMSESALSRATEPFFTTKDPGSGMGLGLFITRGVVDLLGGTLDIQSKHGEGTRVVVTLPDAAATKGRIAPVLLP
jgi:two-component system sensor histidine kinase RegB